MNSRYVNFRPAFTVEDEFAGGRVQPDTNLDFDTVLGGEEAGSYMVSYSQMYDGSVLAWKTLVLGFGEQCDSAGAGTMPGGAVARPPGEA